MNIASYIRYLIQINRSLFQLDKYCNISLFVVKSNQILSGSSKRTEMQSAATHVRNKD